jgi:lysyl-tRNA synthetase class 2
MEVDCPIVSQCASVDAHIDLIPAIYNHKTPCFLHSSPEYGMKRLLSLGIGDIFQLSHVFRDGEFGEKHNPEFTMIEWYRVGMPFEKLIQETCDICRLFLGDLPSHIISYKEAFETYLQIDPFTASDEQLKRLLGEECNGSRDDLLNYLLGMHIEPHLGKDRLTVLAYYPPSQAALSQTKVIDHHVVAERFEIYYQGIELANGYHELQDHQEQLKRLHEANRLRKLLGKSSLPIDMRFIEALQKGLPDCSGVAVGFDRLMMLRHKRHSIHDVLPFGWEMA